MRCTRPERFNDMVNRMPLEWIHLDVVGRLTPSKDGYQEFTTPDRHTPTWTPKLNHPNLTTQICKPNLNTAPTCATSITNTNSNPHSSNSTSSNPYINPTPTSISSSTPSTSDSTSVPPSTPAPPLNLAHHEHFAPLTGGVFMAFQDECSVPLRCEWGGSASNETCARCRWYLIWKDLFYYHGWSYLIAASFSTLLRTKHLSQSNTYAYVNLAWWQAWWQSSPCCFTFKGV
jgi:hypothetical protein